MPSEPEMVTMLKPVTEMSLQLASSSQWKALVDDNWISFGSNSESQ